MEMKKLIKRTESENEVRSYDTEGCSCVCGLGISHDSNDETLEDY